MLRLSGVVARVRGEDYPIGERESEVANCAMRAMPYLDPNRPVSVWTVRLADGRPHGTWKYGVPQWAEVYVATFELSCEDCHGTGMVPSIGPEAGEEDGHVPCQSCQEIAPDEWASVRVTYAPKGAPLIRREGGAK